MIIDCANCEAQVAAEVKSRYFVHNEDGAWEVLFLKCPQCNGPLLASREHLGTDRAGNQFRDLVRMYPPPDPVAHPGLPSTVSEAYEEAWSCFKARAFAATAVLCRKSLEAMCREQGVPKSKLAHELRELKERGVIETRLFEWAEALRIAGNEAAHDVSRSVSKQDATDILEFTDALLQYVFTFKHRFDEFMKRRAEQTASPD